MIPEIYRASKRDCKEDIPTARPVAEPAGSAEGAKAAAEPATAATRTERNMAKAQTIQRRRELRNKGFSQNRVTNDSWAMSY
jgi:hypothetical protein